MHYGPSRIGMFQVQQMLKRLANDNRYEEYDQDVLFAYFRPAFQSPDYQEMMKFIAEKEARDRCESTGPTGVS